jgi:hypothetical protein
MGWTCIIVVDNGPRERESAGLVAALRHARRAAGDPPQAAVYFTRGSAQRTTFLLSPEASRLAADVLPRFDATACAQPPNLRRYAPLPL